MTNITIKGHEIQKIHIKDSCDRRALQIKNNIIKLLGTIGVIEDDVDVSLERIAIKRAPAHVSWYFDKQHLYFSYNSTGKFVENLAVIYKVLELEITALVEERMTVDEFVAKYREEHDVKEKRKLARETLGLEHDEIDLDVINKKYKDLAKEHHPDKEGGDTEKFKEINNAHKTLKRELQ
ncbi:molecular chaperone DnaJ [Candidatus Woesearchaeota archaeon CG10_big_fil_rev_8_21_14_0_10_32_9]|nr:MAG: molecular chaperone DnaJ [Candidatus Woesearchaeota archaeon CG10_big_fil_rev_8_21_14_0_10_32_9]